MKIDGLDSRHPKQWLEKLHSPPAKRVGFSDFHDSDGYGIDQMHVLKLENGRYATVRCGFEGPCCFPDEPDVELYPNAKAAKGAFKRWRDKKRKEEHYTEREYSWERIK